MKRIASILLLACLGTLVVLADDKPQPAFQIADNTFFDPNRKEEKDPYVFHVDYRVEAGYVQHWQKTRAISYPDMYLHGVRVGATFAFSMPYHFSLQTGVLYTLVYGKSEQHWRSVDAPSVQVEYLKHRVLEHNLTIPLRTYYTIPLWKQLNLFFYTGPQLHIGLAETDYIQDHLSEGTRTWLASQSIPVSTYDRMADEIWRANIQWGLGGGFEWDCYRLESGYDFGLNNLVRHPQLDGQHLSEWGWFVSFSYRF